MIINRTVEFVNYRSPSYTGTGRTPLFLRNIAGQERGHDTVEISEQARRRFLDNGGSPLEKAILRALPSAEHLREHLRDIEHDTDARRKERVDGLKSKLLREHYDIDTVVLKQTAEELVSHFAEK